MENIIGKRIKEIRMSLGYTQQQFADSVDISKPMVSYIESGKRLHLGNRFKNFQFSKHINRLHYGFIR